MPPDSASPSAGTGRLQELPPHLAVINDAEPDDRPVPSLGLGDEEAAQAMVLATRLMLLASTPDAVVAAVATFAVQLGGRLIPASADRGTAIPLDITLGTTSPVLVDSDELSLTRMRLEQYLPALVEDARLVTARLRHVTDLETAVHRDPAAEPLPRCEVPRQDAGLGNEDMVSSPAHDRRALREAPELGANRTQVTEREAP
jgi:hypothetical protein